MTFQCLVVTAGGDFTHKVSRSLEKYGVFREENSAKKFVLLQFKNTVTATITGLHIQILSNGEKKDYTYENPLATSRETFGSSVPVGLSEGMNAPLTILLEQVVFSDGSTLDYNSEAFLPDDTERDEEMVSRSSVDRATTNKSKIIIAIMVTIVVVIVCGLGVLRWHNGEKNRKDSNKQISSSADAGRNNLDIKSDDSIIRFEGLEMRFPHKWEFSPEASDDDGFYFADNADSHGFPRLYTMTLDSRGAQRLPAESVSKMMNKTFGGDMIDTEATKMAGYDAVIFDMDNVDQTTGNARIRGVMVNNTSYAELLVIMCAVEHGGKTRELNDINYIVKHAKRTDEQNSLETKNIFDGEISDDAR